ncbi:MAG: dihydropteroate synthase [Ardenticatenaceae bacterium]|nr:dihydropteroate synthase [Ardenticatenaceae bacterium]HBY94268.1 dihydropteroate synthase [Chloroflexota bacterium]
MSERLLVRLVRPHSAAALGRELAALELDSPAWGRLQEAADWYRIWLEPLDPTAAHIVKENLLAAGGDALLPPPLYAGVVAGGPVLLLGSTATLHQAVEALAQHQWPSLQAVAAAVRTALTNAQAGPPSLQIGPLHCVWGTRTYIMGIVNLTPDSFSGDGLLAHDEAVAAALDQARSFVEWGATIVDVGGESTRPGSEAVGLEEELARVIPAIEEIARELGHRVAISVDTYKAEVARQAVAAGAHLVNDVWALRMDPAMAATVAELGVPVIVMHNRMRPKNAVQEARLGGRYLGIHYDHLMADVVRELGESLELAAAAGVPPERIIVDPGIGFGKTVEQSLELLDRLDELRVFGRPILLGPSRKSFIGYTLELPPEERVEGTAATVAVGIARGADIIRVHDVREIARVVRMTDAIVRGGRQRERPGA